MAAYLIRRLAYGALTVLGVLFLLFVLFFAVTDPDDIARKAVGERARPEVYAQWKKNHGYDKPLFLNREHGAFDGRRYTDTQEIRPVGQSSANAGELHSAHSVRSLAITLALCVPRQAAPHDARKLFVRNCA